MLIIVGDPNSLNDGGTWEFMQVYIIDFGLAKKYRDLQTHKHIPYRYTSLSVMIIKNVSCMSSVYMQSCSVFHYS